MAIHKAWMPLIESGCSNLILRSKKIKVALHSLVAENSLLITVGTRLVVVPIIIDDVWKHIMECACLMRALKNEGFQYRVADIAKPYYNSCSCKSKLNGMHLATLGPILKAMDFSEVVLLDLETACPMSPRLSFLEVPMLPPAACSAGLAGELTTPTTPQKLHKQVTPDKLVKCAVDVPVDDPAADVSVYDQ